MSEEIKLSTTAARMVIGMSGKKHYTIPKQVTLAKMTDDFHVEMENGVVTRGKAGDYIGIDSRGSLMVVSKDSIGTTYRPARAPKTSKKVPEDSK